MSSSQNPKANKLRGRLNSWFGGGSESSYSGTIGTMAFHLVASNCFLNHNAAHLHITPIIASKLTMILTYN